LFDVFVVMPAGQQHLICGESSKRAASRTASVVNGRVVDCEGRGSQYVSMSLRSSSG
jgi:hypothetical protein